MKKVASFARGVKKQLRHPAVGKFLRDEAVIAASTGFNPEVAGLPMAARAGKEVIDTLARTWRHRGK
jgi:hypothetical protein